MSSSMLIVLIVGVVVVLGLGVLLSRLDKGMHGSSPDKTSKEQDTNNNNKNSSGKKK